MLQRTAQPHLDTYKIAARSQAKIKNIRQAPVTQLTHVELAFKMQSCRRRRKFLAGPGGTAHPREASNQNGGLA